MLLMTVRAKQQLLSSVGNNKFMHFNNSSNEKSTPAL